MLRKIISLKTVDSTNNYIANLISSGEIQPNTAVLAEQQLNGKGQRAAVWESEGGKNLTASLYMQPKQLLISNAFCLSMLVATTLCRYVRNLGIDAQIKWPNDLLVNKKKIAGILIENQLQGEFVHSSIIGIGLNVNQTNFSLPQATSIINETGKNLNIQEVGIDLFTQLSEALTLRPFDFQEISSEYYTHLFGYRQVIDVHITNNNVVQKIQVLGVEPSGLLKAQTLQGDIKLFDLKELKFDLQNAF